MEYKAGAGNVDGKSWTLGRTVKVTKDALICSFALDRSGLYLAAGTNNGDMFILSTASMSIHRKLIQAHGLAITGLSFSPEKCESAKETQLISCSADWDCYLTVPGPSFPQRISTQNVPSLHPHSFQSIISFAKGMVNRHWSNMGSSAY